MDYTKQIMYYSNQWYNDGLRKAKVRDLSGAVVSLRQSLRFNKGNIAARILLGLVYYGRGEVAEALVEWIISKNLRPGDNIASEYIRRVQQSAKKLEKVNQAVKKYNQCLVYCAQGGEDMALIQLKQVVSAHPSFLKAHQLLAVLYLRKKQYSKANQELKTARKLDTTNEITMYYMHELSQAGNSRIHSQEKKENRQRKMTKEHRLGNETVIQPAYRVVKKLSAKASIVNIVIGACIGAAIIWYLIVPAVDEAKAGETNRQIIEYSEQINTMEAQISALTRTLEDYRTAGDDSEAAKQTAASTSDSYENLLTAVEQYNSGNYTADTIADTLLNINRDLLGATGQTQYDTLTGNIYPNACSIKYEAGVASLNVANYETAIDNLYKVVRMDETYDEGGALLNLGIAYLRNGDSESASTWLQKVIDSYPDTEYAQEAQNNLNSIAQSAETEGENAETTTE